MNTFKLYLDGSEIKGTVFPFRFGELLDERLDEAYVDFYGSDVEAYKPLTEAKIEIIQDKKVVETLDFIVANDNSQEYPIGSKKYKHSLYLLERTKLLDGVVCGSLTFTNQTGSRYGKTQAQFEDLYNSDKRAQIIGFVFDVGIPGTIDEDEELHEFPSAKYVSEKLAQTLQEENGWHSVNAKEIFYIDNGNNHEELRSYAKIETKIINGTSTTYYSGLNWDKVISVKKPKNTLTLTYQVGCGIRANIASDEVDMLFIFRYTINVVASFKPLKKWTITDCVNRVLECATPLFGTENPKYTFEGVTYKNGQISGEYTGQAAQYEQILAPEFSMTQSTLREQLKVIGSFIHAEPWLDGNNVVHFQSLEAATQWIDGAIPYVYASAKTDINQFCTDIRSSAQNVVSSLDDKAGTITTPGANAYRSLRSEELYSRITEGNAIVATEYPIYSIISVKCGIAKNESSYLIDPVDITGYIFEATEYNANLSSYEGEYPCSKSYALYYTIGEKNIKGLDFKPPNALDDSYSHFAISNILGMMNTNGLSPGDIQKNLVNYTLYPNLVFQVTYKPIYPLHISHGKQELFLGNKYSQMYNQTENMLEAQYFGENLKGVAARLGNTDKEKTYILNRFARRPSVGQMLGGYAISAVNAEIMPSHIKCTLGLSKDFNRISEYVGVSSVKRLYEISERNVYERTVLIKESLVIGNKEEYDKLASDKKSIFSHTWTAFVDIFKKNDQSVQPNLMIKNVTAWGYGKKGNTQPQKMVVLPVMTSQLGNVVAFTFSYKDNYSAGNTTELITEGDAKGRWQSDVRYTDYYGRIYWLWFVLGTLASENKNDAFLYPDVTTPQMHQSIRPPYNLRLRKDNRERITVTYEIEAKSNDPNIIIYSEFMKLCRYINNAPIPKLKLVVFENDYPLDKFDGNYYKGNSWWGSEYNLHSGWIDTKNWGFTIDTTGDKYFDGMLVPTVGNHGKGWAIVTEESEETYENVLDEDGNIITQTIKSEGKFLIASTAKNTGPIKLDFFMIRE